MNRHLGLVLCFAMLFALSGVPCLSELSVDLDPEGALLSLALLAGGEDPEPWPVVRLHLPLAQVLNPDGGSGPYPDGSPSLGWDPLAGTPEVTWARHDGDDYEIVISRWSNDHWTSPELLTSNDVDDLDPAIAYAPDGTARITYWSDGEVFYSTRLAGGDWSGPEAVDSGVRSSVAGTSADRTAFQRTNGSVEEIVASRRSGNWVSTVVATTTFGGFDGSGDLDVRLESWDATVWIVWEDSTDYLGWCKLLDGETWSAVSYEPLSGPDDEERARLRVKFQVID